MILTRDAVNRLSSIITITDPVATLSSSNYIAELDCSANDITLNLPDAALSTGLSYIIKKVDGTPNEAVVEGFGAQTIEGEANVVLLSQEGAYPSVTLVCDGTKWAIH